MNCTQCHKLLEISAEDCRFYQKFDVPKPTLCPACRMRRRMVWRNERKFYHRSCDLCRQSIVSMYPADTPHPVYCSPCFWSDRWDAMQYGRDFDFNRPFFDQFHALLKRVPREALIVVGSENCAYNNHCRFSKNCYCCSLIGNSENCHASYWIWDSKDIVNCSYVNKSEFCADSFHLLNSYQSIGCVDCANSRSCYFSYDLEGCQDCLFSWNLTGQRYRIFNQQYSRQDYERIFRNLRTDSWVYYQKARREFRERVLINAIRRNARIVNSDDCTGDNLIDCKNVYYTFDAVDCEDVRYCTSLLHVKDAMDCYSIGIKPSELIYESCVSRENNQNIQFTNNVFSSQSIRYSDSVMQSKDCFGCVGVRNKRFCILNRQYSEKEYGELVLKIREQMEKMGEYGEYFPMRLSPFAYNETVAMDYDPLSKNEALALGARWQDPVSETTIPSEGETIQAEDLPDSIREVNDSICRQMILCAKTRRPYRITHQELVLYRNLSIPLPRTHPDVRHAERLIYRNSRTLFTRSCSKCCQSMVSIYPDDRKEMIYCEACYSKEKV